MVQTIRLLAQEEHLRDLGAPPWVFGVVAFVILATLLRATLAFGKGRQHS